MAAIPTTYNGIRFRSRLEARWAAFFDLTSYAQWSYEPVDLPGWIPDFSLEFETKNRPLLAEVKPVYTPDQFREQGDLHKILVAMCDDMNREQIIKTSYDFDFIILGTSYKCAWYIGLGPEFRPIFTSASYEKAWKEAGNRTQWKRPA